MPAGGFWMDRAPLATIRGIAVNNDGFTRESITFPNGDAQAALARKVRRIESGRPCQLHSLTFSSCWSMLQGAKRACCCLSTTLFLIFPPSIFFPKTTTAFLTASLDSLVTAVTPNATSLAAVPTGHRQMEGEPVQGLRNCGLRKRKRYRDTRSEGGKAVQGYTVLGRWQHRDAGFVGRRYRDVPYQMSEVIWNGGLQE